MDAKWSRGRRPVWHALVLSFALMLAFAATASAATRHVAATGSDTTNDCISAGTPCASVGHAVTQASGGDTISIGSGVFTGSGQVTIDKDLTLNGAGDSQTMLRPGYDTPFAQAWFNVTDGNSLDVNDLTFDGNADGGDQVFFAIRYHGTATGAIDSVGFEDIRWDRYFGFGAVTNKGGLPDPASVDLDVTNSTFQDIERVGVLYKGADVTGTFSDNTYIGKGDGDFLDYALDISAGADVTVTGNTVRANRGVASSDGSTSAAFLVSTFWGPGTVATVNGNDLSANTAGVHVGFDGADTSAVSMARNRVAGNADGVVTRASAINAENNWWGCNAGPGNAGCDSVATDGGGSVDSDPRVVLGVNANPASVETGGGTSQITAQLTQNSAGQSVGAGVPNEVPVAFATDLGSVSPATGSIGGGTAASTFTAGASTGTATVSATLDNQTSSAPVAVVNPPEPEPVPNDPGIGTPGPDELIGGEGADVLDGGAGDDTLLGEAGDDLLEGGDGADEVLGGEGDDEVRGGEGPDLVDGGVGDDDVRGGAGTDVVDGGGGDDQVKGGSGGDQIDGGPGEDDIGGGHGQDTIDSQDGEPDTVRCGQNVDELNADGKDEFGPNCENVV